MARVHGVEKLFQLSRAARSIDRDIQKDAVKALRRSLAPVVPDARSRFRGLGGTGPKTARSVGMSVTTKRVELFVGGPSVPYWGGREFGADRQATRSYQWSNQFGKGISFTGVKRIDYSSPRIFGPNRGTAGRAFIPAVARGLRRANREADRLSEELIEKLARAGGG